jgi:hypothetical protein
MISRYSPIGQAFCFTLALGLVAGCSSGDEFRPIRQPETQRAATRASIPEMAGDARFFDGQIETEVQLGRGSFAPRASADSETGGRNGRGGPGGVSGGFGGGRRGGRGMGGGPRNADLAATGEGPGRTNNAGAIRASQEPPVRLRLRVTNHGAEPADIEVTDFDSSLGNFVVQPRKLTIAPGQSVEMDPMNSQLGVAGGEIPLTVGVRANGKTEKQTVTLKQKEPAAPPAAN